MASIPLANGTEIREQTEMKSMDANRYATKKTIAQGMLDIALLTANASQLKYILQIGDRHEFYKLMLVMISSSIILQIITGVLLVFLSLVRMHEGPTHRALADRLNHITLGLVFFAMFLDTIKMNFGFVPAVRVDRA